MKYKFKVTKCREPIRCSLCHQLIKKGEYHEAWYCGNCKEWARHVDGACKKKNSDIAPVAQLDRATDF